MAGWVYIISNKAMPGILKIGYTERTPYIRAYELYHTGCPYPYQVDYSIYVNNPYEVEQKAHELQRLTNVGKEWFSCSYNEAVLSINQAVTLTGSQIEENRKAPQPTQEQLSDVIRKNPAVIPIIKEYRENEYLSSVKKNTLHLSPYDRKTEIEKEQNKIRIEFLDKEKNIKKPFSTRFYEFFPMVIFYLIGVSLLYYYKPSFFDILDKGLFGIVAFLIISAIAAPFATLVLILFAVQIGAIISVFIPNKLEIIFANILGKITSFYSELFQTEVTKSYYEECEKLNKERDDILQKLEKLKP